MSPFNNIDEKYLFLKAFQFRNDFDMLYKSLLFCLKKASEFRVGTYLTDTFYNYVYANRVSQSKCINLK